MKATCADNRDRVIRRPLLVVPVCVCILFLVGLGRYDLRGADEPRVAGITAIMARSGDPIVPNLNGRPFLEKPPFYHWTAAPIFTLLGESTYSTRLPSALAAIGGVLLTFVLARRMGLSVQASSLSALILATFAGYWSAGHECLIDMMLCLCTTGAMLCFFEAVGTHPHRNLWAVGFTLSLACALLTKGAVGLAVPFSALAIWLLARRDFSFRAWSVLMLGSLLSLIPMAVWIGLLCDRLGAETVWPALVANNFGRFTGKFSQHSEPFYYYLVKSPPQFFPWILFLPVAVAFHLWQFRHRWQESPSLFLLVWFAMPFLLLCISVGKRNIYLLPLYPAAALFIGQAVGAVVEGKESRTNWFTIPAEVVVWSTFVTSLVFIGMPFYFRQPWTIWLVIGLPAIYLAFVAHRRLAQDRMKEFLGTLFPALLAVYLMVSTAVYPIFNQQESFKPLFDYCRLLRSDGIRIGLANPRERISGAAVLYLGQTVPELFQTEDIVAFLNAPGKSAVVADERCLRSLADMDTLREFIIGRRRIVVAARTPRCGE